MNADWIKSPTARRVLVHWADVRPAWLWSQDGEKLLWRNEAARFFHGRIKKHGVKLAEAVPIKGQIARLIRLGSLGRSSLSRIQFLAGDRPISTTCTCTPLELPGNAQVLLIVGVDAIEPELLEAQAPGQVDPMSSSLFPEGSEFLLISDDSQVATGSRVALERYAGQIESEGLPALPPSDSGVVDIGGEPVTLTRYRASPHDALLLLFEPAAAEAPSLKDVRADEGTDPQVERGAVEAPPEPLLPLGLGPEEPVPVDHEPAGEPTDGTEDWVEPLPPAEPEVPGTLASLFDRLADDDGLYGTLTEADATFAGPPAEIPETVFVEAAPEAPVEIGDVRADEGVDPDFADAPALSETESIETPAKLAGEPMEIDDVVSFDAIGALIEYANDEPDYAADLPAGEVTAELTLEPAAENEVVQHAEVPVTLDGDPVEPEADEASEAEAERATTWRVIGRGFVPLSDDATVTDEPQEEPEPVEAPQPAPDPETVDRVSRYNFDELSRILSDRVTNPQAGAASVEKRPATASAEGSLINLAGETFILNRLPLGILVFRDQQVLFANRALTELTGHDSIESVRAGGLTSIFPAEDATGAGPVTQLVRRDGSLTAVNARLQSITWHGKPALMLSASSAGPQLGHEGAVRAFAELSADVGEEGFIATDRAGMITTVSLHGRIVLGLTEADLVGKPVAALVEPGALGELKLFLERPARFAETARPGIRLPGTRNGTELALFAEGQAGIVAGYFGFVRKVATAATPTAVSASPRPGEDIEPSMLVRISRGVRRPLNTIIGFAEIIGSAPPGSAESQRHGEHARDIRTAGLEIATLVDELDDYARLRDGRYTPAANDIDLVELLDSCVLRVRTQAAEARVLVRSAVSESLPRITADAASLTQAILNLLASAIDQTPVGGSVILSAQQEDDGAVVVNVRDSGESRSDLGERFVVFRDGIGKDGETLAPVRSSVGLALTRSLLAVNALSLSVDPTAGVGTLFSLLIPADLVHR
ncbi:ATP-binding protein [Devosia sp.]|uniref:ATP-binding protein n=1 Tax=Devosia sp. TaxID=1871048 RepID=UPI003BA8CD4F